VEERGPGAKSSSSSEVDIVDTRRSFVEVDEGLLLKRDRMLGIRRVLGCGG
jgi:hypothetical protein